MRRLNLIISSLTAVLIISINTSAELRDQIQTAVRSLGDLTAPQVQTVVTGIMQTAPQAARYTDLNNRQLQGLLGIVNSGLFEEVELSRIGRVAGMGLGPLASGVDPETVQEIALVGFSQDISQERFDAACEALDLLQTSQVPSEIYRYAVSYVVYNQWSPENIVGLARGIIQGQGEGLPLDKLTLALIIRVDQGLGGVPIEQAIDEEIEFIRQIGGASPVRARRDSIYNSMRRAVEGGVPEDIAQDFYFNAVEENWSAEDAEILFQGLAEGVEKGLTPEKLAVAFIVRMEQDRDRVSAKRIAREEIEFVSSLESKRVELKKKAVKIPKIPEPVKPEKPAPRAINLPLMSNSIQSFIGVPYVWGGESRKGTDCSGFTLVVYREQGVRLPRVSRQQFRTGISVPSKRNLSFGDLVFFNKNGYGRITHVGIYVGGGRFAHASCSKGVTYSRLNKRYYNKRFTGARRILM